MSDILIINTGGTFNKYYDARNGELMVDKSSKALGIINQKWMSHLSFLNIIGKDSLEFDDNDRMLILKEIKKFEGKVVIIHGTDTIHITADFLDKNCKDKVIVLTGAMVPFSIEPIEATANFAMSYGFVNGCNQNGIYICMNGQVDNHLKIKKDKAQGRFGILSK